MAQYDAAAKANLGGGNHAEGEDIEVIEMSIQDAMRAIQTGEIEDGKTIMLLQHAHIHLFSALPEFTKCRLSLS